MSTRDRGRTRRSRLATASLALLLILGGTLLLGHGMLERSSAPRDLDGRPVVLDDVALPDASARGAMQVVEPSTDSSGARFRVPSVGLDVGIGALREVGGDITPPGFSGVYQVTNRGVGIADHARGRVFVVTHSVRDGRAPGNALRDLGVGTAILVDGVDYTTTSTERVSKSELAVRDDIWADTPGTLVVITCLQREHGPSLDNVVITATAEPRSTSAPSSTLNG